jgi:MFS family permease
VHLAPATLGIIFGFGGVSALLGALLAERAIKRWGMGRAILWGLALYVGTTWSLPLASGPAWLAITLLALGQLGDGAYTVYTIGKASLLQTLFPASILGRLHASLRFIEALATLLGLALGGSLGSVIGVRATLFVAAGGMLLAPLWLTCSPIRRLEGRAPFPRRLGTPVAHLWQPDTDLEVK